jgi:protein gp37
MGRISKIQWTDHTFNPWRGCAKVSAGCEHCYAERLAKRMPAIMGEWGINGRRGMAAEAYWRQAIAWNRAAEKAGVRRRVFCGSMMDVFEDRPELHAPRARLFDTISATADLDWLLLTKRPENVLRLIAEMRKHLLWEDQEDDLDPLRLPNVSIGTSIENQAAADERVPQLLRCPAALRFLSCEPLLGPITLTLEGIRWVIVGGESGPGARPCDVAWLRSIRDQCKAAGTACFIKQLGSRPFDSFYRGGVADQSVHVRDPKGGDISEFPRDLQVREFPND